MNEPRYHYRASWSHEDDAWVGVCNGFLLLSHIAPTEAACLDGIRALVDDIVADLRSEGAPLPAPLPWDAYDTLQLDTAVGSAG